MFTCKKCGKEGDRYMFPVHPQCMYGIDTGRCLPCKNEESRASYHNSSNERRILNRAKSRATRKGWEFSLVIEDIIIPDECPVFHKPFIYGDPDWTPSIDRFNSALGYTKENICIISNKANRIKNDSTVQDLSRVLLWMSRL